MTAQTIIVSRELIAQATAYCATTLPDEACAVLLGEQTNSGVRVNGMMPIPNAAAKPHSAFVCAPSVWVSIVLNPELSRRIIGIIHSHPTSEAVPSAADLAAQKQTGWRFATCWIVSLREPRQPVVRAYRIEDGSYKGQQLCIHDE